MLFKILDKLRSKPKAVRDQYSFLIAVTLTFVIGGFWSLSLPERFHLAIPGSLAVSTSSAPTAPFSNFFSQFKDQFASVKEAVTNAPSSYRKSESSPSSTTDARGLKLTPENKEAIIASSTDYVYKNPSEEDLKTTPTILIATSSATRTPAY